MKRTERVVNPEHFYSEFQIMFFCDDIIDLKLFKRKDGKAEWRVLFKT